MGLGVHRKTFLMNSFLVFGAMTNISRLSYHDGLCDARQVVSTAAVLYLRFLPHIFLLKSLLCAWSLYLSGLSTREFLSAGIFLCM